MNPTDLVQRRPRRARQSLLAQVLPLELTPRTAAAFTAVCVAGCALAWLGGYDFQTRDPAVAVGTAAVLALGLLAASLFSR